MITFFLRLYVHALLFYLFNKFSPDCQKCYKKVVLMTLRRIYERREGRSVDESFVGTAMPYKAKFKICQNGLVIYEAPLLDAWPDLQI